MTTSIPTLQWSESEPPVEILSGEQLDGLLDNLTASSRSDFPSAVELQAHGFSVHILLSLAESFVYVNDQEHCQEWITVGNPKKEGTVNFWLLGQHHTEFNCSHLVPMSTARRIVREFFDTGQRSQAVTWKESCY